MFALLAGFIGLFIVAVANFATLLPEFAPQLKDFGANVDGLPHHARLRSGADPGDRRRDSNPGQLASFAGSLLGGVTGIITFLVIVLTCLILMGVDGGYVPNVLRQVQPRRPAPGHRR